MNTVGAMSSAAIRREVLFRDATVADTPKNPVNANRDCNRKPDRQQFRQNCPDLENERNPRNTHHGRTSPGFHMA